MNTQTALITGASSGIGMEFARVFAAAGYNLVLVARSEDKLNELAAELRKNRTRVRVLPADLSVMKEVERVVQTLKMEGEEIQVLVNNAGFGEWGLFHETRWDREAMMIDLNVKSLVYLTKLFVQPMVERNHGRILNVASTAAFQPGPTMAVYYATKAFVLSFSEAIANELEGTGVTVTALCPGPTESGFQKAAEAEESRLFKGRKMPSSREVAEYGFQAMLRGKTVAIHGTVNRIGANSVKFIPRKWVTKLVRKIQERAK